jgi:hypothetical protein
LPFPSQQAKIVNERLKADLEVVDTQMPHLLAMKDQMAQILSADQSHNVHPASETLATIQSQLDRLRQVQASVQKRTQTAAFQRFMKRTENRSRQMNSLLSKYLDRQRIVGNKVVSGKFEMDRTLLASPEELKDVEVSGMVPEVSGLLLFFCLSVVVVQTQHILIYVAGDCCFFPHS